MIINYSGGGGNFKNKHPVYQVVENYLGGSWFKLRTQLSKYLRDFSGEIFTLGVILGDPQFKV